MSEDADGYSHAVVELEKLIGVPAGDRNPKDTTHFKTQEQHSRCGARMQQFRWGAKTLNAELHDDGALIYSINYGEELCLD